MNKTTKFTQIVEHKLTLSCKVSGSEFDCELYLSFISICPFEA